MNVERSTLNSNGDAYMVSRWVATESVIESSDILWRKIVSA